MTRSQTLLTLLLLLPLTACPPPIRKERTGAGANGTATRSATASPAGGGPAGPAARYDPAKDPANVGGWAWSPPRSAEDLADRVKKPFSIEALYRLRSVADPRWSPDGAWILFVVTTHELKAGKSNAEIYRVNADGSDLRRMTRHKGADNHPRWAPDGKSFLFVSTRKGDKPQIWRMPADGGEPEQITDLSTGVSSPIWSPDGKRVAYASRVFPDCGADDAKNKAALAKLKESPIQAHLADELLYRHWTSFSGGRRSHIFVRELEGGKTVDVTPGDFESPAFSLGGEGFAFSPDGEELCFVSNRSAPSARAWTTNKDLFVVPVGGGEVRNLTADNKAYDGHPAYSPDGRYIAFLRQDKPGYEADRFRLALYDRKSGQTRLLGAGFGDWVLDFRWSADSRAVVFKAPIKGRFPLLSVDVQRGSIRRLQIPSVRSFALSRAGRLAFTHSAVDRPLELYTADPAGAKARRLTHLNKAVAETHDLRPVEELWLPGAAGKKVHTFVVKPHGFRAGERYPLIINVHGGPQYQWADAFRGDWQVYPGAGYVVAFFNPHGSIGYGQPYTAAISKDWAGKVYQDVMKVTDALEQLPYVDPARVGAMGWSYGGYMMNWLLGHTKRFKALVSMMGLYDLVSFYGATEELWFPEWDVGGTPWDSAETYRSASPSSYAARFSTPTLVISGMRDYRVPYTQSLQLFTALRRRGVPARLILLPNDGHWPSYVKSMPLYYAAHLDWFHRYLGGGPSPYDIKQLVRGTALKK
jgi:dipeptidyl aminopeptidase/acylaminoacyl peptidase